MDGTNRIDELEQKFIENPRRYFAPLANEYRKAGNPQQAIAICRAHLAQLPGHMSGQIVYGQALFEGGEYDQAQTVFENALAMDRENLVALRHLGDLALRKGETAAARQWYSKILEIDPRDANVIALVGEIDSAAEAQSSTTDAEPASTTTPESVQPMPEPPPAQDESRVDEEDSLIAEELGYPVPPAHAFVTETMAELYLAQGFRDRAVSVYRQLVEMRPGEERLRNRLAELEEPGGITEAASAFESAPSIAEAPSAEVAPAAESPEEEFTSPAPQFSGEDLSATAPVEARRDEEPSVESPELHEEDHRSPSIETPMPSPEIQAPSEESGAGQTHSIDSPPGEAPEAEPESVEAVIPDEPRAEPEGVAAFEHSADETSVRTGEFASEPLHADVPRSPTVREFFANLGKCKPARLNGSSSNGAGHARPALSSYGDSSSESDAKAAAALAGAFGGAPGAPSFSEAPASPATGKESEEDVARFRAWLDGLTT